jgi:hypothetical protein
MKNTDWIRLLIQKQVTTLLCCLAFLPVMLCAQSAPSEQDQFVAEQRALGQELQALQAQGATPQQMEAWHKKNAARFAAQQQRAMDMAADSALQPAPVMGQANIPANASGTLKDFLATQAEMANARAQIHNQLLNGLPAEVTPEQISQMQQSETKLFEQQQGANLKLQAQRAQALAEESARQPLPVPPPLSLSPDTTPQMAAFLTARDQLMRDQIQLHNQYLTATPAVRDAAMEQWRKQNASRFQQMQTLSQNLSQTNSTPQN